MTDESDLELAAERFGTTVEQLRRLPRHEPTCLIGKPHLTCTCGAYGRPAPKETDQP